MSILLYNCSAVDHIKIEGVWPKHHGSPADCSRFLPAMIATVIQLMASLTIMFCAICQSFFAKVAQ